MLNSNYNFVFNSKLLDNRFKISFGQDNASLYERAIKENWSQQDFAWYYNKPCIIDDEINKNNSLLSYYSRKENPIISWIKLDEL